MPEDKIRVSARIPKSLCDKCLQRYDNITTAINAGLELLCQQSEDTCQTHEDTRQQSEDTSQTNEDTCQTREDSISKEVLIELRARLEYVTKEKNAEILRLQKVIQESPDPVELAEVRAHFEGLQKLLEEKDKMIEVLNRDVETLNVFAHYFKNTEVKQLQAPAVEKKSILSRLKFW